MRKRQNLSENADHLYLGLICLGRKRDFSFFLFLVSLERPKLRKTRRRSRISETGNGPWPIISINPI